MLTTKETQQLEKVLRATAEAHEVTRELHAAIKDAHNVLKELDSFLTSDIQQTIHDRVDIELEVLGKQAHDHINKVARKVLVEFERLTKPLYKTLGILDETIVRLEDE